MFDCDCFLGWIAKLWNMLVDFINDLLNPDEQEG